MVKILTLWLLSLFFIATTADASVLRGKIIDNNGAAVSYATVFVRETSTGVSADSNGEFILNLSPGTYTLDISSMGYKRERVIKEISDEEMFASFVLHEEVYRLDDVYFRRRADNRAVYVMRRAIARAPFHRQQIRDYESSVYLKGNMIVSKIPAVFRIGGTGRDMSRLLLNKMFVVESHSHIEYSYPGRYNEVIKAFSTTIPAEIEAGDVSGIVKTSIYDKEFYGKLSPLAPNSFTYYNFNYEGIHKEGERVVNKIRVTPKRGDIKLVEGYIYIADDLWSVYYYDFIFRETGVETNVKVSYNEIKNGIMAPISYTMDVKVGVMGIQASGQFFSSISYSSLNKQEKPVTEEILPMLADDLTKRDAQRIASRSQEKISATLPQPETRKESLEIIRDTNIRRKVDTLASVRDSSYWVSIRAIPLLKEEQISYKVADSIKREVKKISDGDSSGVANSLMLGKRHKVTDRLSLGYGGVAKIVGDFNFVDGYLLGQEFYGSLKLDTNRQITVTPQLYYSTHRKKVLWSFSGTYNHSPMRLASLSADAGYFSRDISNNSPVTTLINSYSSSFFGVSPVKFFSAQWAKLLYETDIVNGLRVKTELSYNKAEQLISGNFRSLFGASPDLNETENVFYNELPIHKTALFGVAITYTPRYYYRVINGKKRYLTSKYPTFGVSFKSTLNGGNVEYSKFSVAELSVRQSFNFGLYNSVSYTASAGKFLDTERIFINNYKHFRASDIMVTENSFASSFVTLNSYKLSTSGSWITASAEFKSTYILLNRLPFINSPMIKEALHLKSLWLPDSGHSHIEAGYSFGTEGMARAGVFAGFDNGTFSGVVFRIEIPIISSL